VADDLFIMVLSYERKYFKICLTLSLAARAGKKLHIRVMAKWILPIKF
jgi:hypothetical protein